MLHLSATDSYWKDGFDLVLVKDMISKHLDRVPMKKPLMLKIGDGSTFDINLKDLHQFVRTYFIDFSKASPKERNHCLAELIITTILYRNYDNLNYQTVESLNNSCQSPIVESFNDEASFLETFSGTIGETVKNKRILIKPNFVTSEGYPETTNLPLLDKLIKIINQNHPKDVFIVEGPSLFYARDYLTPNIIDPLYETDLVGLKVDGEVGVIHIPRVVYEADLILNLSNLKEHKDAKISGARKNLMGLLPSFERLRFHNNNLELSIESLATTLNPGINIIDARKVLRIAQMKRIGGKVEEWDKIYYSNDVLAMDKLAFTEFYPKTMV